MQAVGDEEMRRVGQAGERKETGNQEKEGKRDKSKKRGVRKNTKRVG